MVAFLAKCQSYFMKWFHFSVKESLRQILKKKTFIKIFPAFRKIFYCQNIRSFNQKVDNSCQIKINNWNYSLPQMKSFVKVKKSKIRYWARKISQKKVPNIIFHLKKVWKRSRANRCSINVNQTKWLLSTWRTPTTVEPRFLLIFLFFSFLSTRSGSSALRNDF